MSRMRKAALFIVPTLIGTAALASSQSAIRSGNPAADTSAAAAAAAQYAAPSNTINQSIVDWRRLRQGNGYSFADYARFLIYNPGWPGESSMRAAAERAMRPGEHAGTVLSFFAVQKPQTGNGWAQWAQALLASGRPVEGLAAAREAWAAGDLGPEHETALYSRFGRSFTWIDHERRADALLFDKKPSEAYRFLALVSPARRPVFEARFAMQSRLADADQRYMAVIGTVTNDAGLMMDRARYLRDTGNEYAARQLAARPHSFAHKPADPDRFLDMLLILAREAVEAGQWTLAYNIARQVDDVFAPGAVISDQPYGVRDRYTSLTWLAGTAAYTLGRPGDAIGAFHRYANGGRSLQVTSKGQYWAGRAALAAGQPAVANAYFASAAAYPELFYGQLALERLGRSVPAPPPMPRQWVTPAQRAAFFGNRLVQATRLMAAYGRSDEAALFVRALAESLKTNEERILATELGQQLRRDDLPVWVGRASRNDGAAFYFREAFPTLTSSVPGGRLWALTHGITRQESSFDRAAVSHAGARGMMQLMPATAREQAGKMGYGYDFGRLTSDANYNVLLGSAYFRRLLNQWDGNIPLAVASYNAGAGNVRKWVRQYGDPRSGTDVVRWIEQIPFMETRGYVQRVIENSVVYDELNPGTPNQLALHVSTYLGKGAPG